MLVWWKLPPSWNKLFAIPSGNCSVFAMCTLSEALISIPFFLSSCLWLTGQGQPFLIVTDKAHYAKYPPPQSGHHTIKALTAERFLYASLRCSSFRLFVTVLQLPRWMVKSFSLDLRNILQITWHSAHQSWAWADQNTDRIPNSTLPPEGAKSEHSGSGESSHFVAGFQTSRFGEIEILCVLLERQEVCIWCLYLGIWFWTSSGVNYPFSSPKQVTWVSFASWFF